MIRALFADFLRVFVSSPRFFVRNFWLGPAQIPLEGGGEVSQQPFSSPEAGPPPPRGSLRKALVISHSVGLRRCARRGAPAALRAHCAPTAPPTGSPPSRPRHQGRIRGPTEQIQLVCWGLLLRHQSPGGCVGRWVAG